jgi:4-amino-4-deoxy-L-arabinose transferase-like glycosyltransferase
MGVCLYGRQGGILAAIVFATGMGVFRYVRVAATDFLLVFSLTLAMYGFVKVLLSSKAGAEAGSDVRAHSSRLSGSLIFYLGIALGVLSKGLIGLVFPLLIVGLFLLLGRGQWQMDSGGRGGQSSVHYSPFAKFYSLFANRYSLSGLLLFLAIVLPWHIMAALKNPGFFQFYIVDNQFLRFLNIRAFVEDDIPVTTFAFLALTIVWFFPWSLFIPAALSQGFSKQYLKQSPVQHLRLLVGMWALVVFGFFSLSTSKLEHYFLPAIPPLSLMVGGLWSKAFIHPDSRGGLRWNLLAAALGCSAVGIALLVWSDRLTSQGLLSGLGHLNVYYRILQDQGGVLPFTSVAPFVQLLKGLGAVLVIGWPLSYILFHFSMPRASFVTVLCISSLVAVLVFNLVLLIEPYHSTRPVAESLVSHSEPNDLVVHEGSLEYSGGLPYYTGRKINVLNGRRGDLDFGSRYSETRYLFLEDDSFARMWQGKQRVFFVSRPGVQQSVLERLPVKKSFLVGRYGSHLLYTNRRMASSQTNSVKSEQ